jgi:ribosome-associated protein
MENLDQKEIISKTTLKKESKDIKKFGEKIAKYNQETLKKFNFPADIYEAIHDLKNIKSNSAKKRQSQYLAKLLRAIDINHALETMEKISLDSRKEIKKNHLIEEWRDKLINNDSELTNFISLYPDINIQLLRQSIINTKKEIENKIGSKHSRQLYKLIRSFFLKS